MIHDLRSPPFPYFLLQWGRPDLTMDGFRPLARSSPGAPFFTGTGPAPRQSGANSSDFDPQPRRFENQHTLKI